MTWSTSDVAVCCSSDSVSSRVRCCSASNSRVFSIAITAWSAKVVASSISLALNGFTSGRARPITPMSVPSRINGTPSKVREGRKFGGLTKVNSGSAKVSVTWMTVFSSAVRPTTEPRPGWSGLFDMNSLNSFGYP